MCGGYKKREGEKKARKKNSLLLVPSVEREMSVCPSAPELAKANFKRYAFINALTCFTDTHVMIYPKKTVPVFPI